MNSAIPFPLMRTMVLVYLPTKQGDFWANVDKYSSTMEHMGLLGVQLFHRVLKEKSMIYNIYI